MEKELLSYLSQSVAWLASQQEDGLFLSHSTPHAGRFSNAKLLHSIFPTALILSSLNAVSNVPEVAKITSKAAALLLSQKSPHWSFNYWKRNSDESRRMPYPDDLDDTFVALSALFEYNPELIDGTALAAITQMLTLMEVRVGGPYYTWLVTTDAPQAWRDSDIAVNSNIGYFLSLHDITLPGLNRFVTRQLAAKRATSRYYPSVFPVLYFASRFLKKKAKEVRSLLSPLRRKDGSWGSPLDTALAVLALLYAGEPAEDLSPAIMYLVKKTRGNRFLPYAFCIDPVMQRKKHYAGAPALTAAFCMEAVAVFLNQINTSPAATHALYEPIIQTVHTRLLQLDSPLAENTLKYVDKILHTDKRKQIPLLPAMFAQSIETPVPEKLLIQLGAANIYGWVAYTIFDNVLDDEPNPREISIATFALREATTMFTSLLPDTGFATHVRHIMDAIDSANAWEVAHARNPEKPPNYGNFRRLADRSLGHALGPVAILYAIGKEKDAEHLLTFFHHYLIAKQLDDDAHDWEKDLARGHVNAIGAMVLKKNKNTYASLQEAFWQEHLDHVAGRIMNHAARARKALRACSCVSRPSGLFQLLHAHEQAAQMAIKERDKARMFMKHYAASASGR